VIVVRYGDAAPDCPGRGNCFVTVREAEKRLISKVVGGVPDIALDPGIESTIRSLKRCQPDQPLSRIESTAVRQPNAYQYASLPRERVKSIRFNVHCRAGKCYSHILTGIDVR
jgi:hypothetical protein